MQAADNCGIARCTRKVRTPASAIHFRYVPGSKSKNLIPLIAKPAVCFRLLLRWQLPVLWIFFLALPNEAIAIFWHAP